MPERERGGWEAGSSWAEGRELMGGRQRVHWALLWNQVAPQQKKKKSPTAKSARERKKRGREN